MIAHVIADIALTIAGGLGGAFIVAVFRHAAEHRRRLRRYDAIAAKDQITQSIRADASQFAAVIDEAAAAAEQWHPQRLAHRQEAT